MKISILCLGLYSTLAFGKGSVDAIQLENIPLDSSVDCSRTFFKSSRNFNGTIYVMPRVVPEARDDERQAFEIESDGKGRYNLVIGLYFPRNEEQVRGEWDADLAKSTSCNFDVVKQELNRGVTSANLQVKRIAPMPLTSIEVRVPGISSIGRIGRSLEVDDEVDILDYDGKSLPIEISISADEKDEIVRRMARADGVPVEVRFRFQARSREGAVSANLDWRQLSSGLSVSFSGKRWVTRAEFEAAVKSNLRTMSESIKIDSGKSAAFDKLVALVIEKITAAAESVAKPESGHTEAPKSKGEQVGNTDAPKEKEKEKSPESGLLNVKVLLEATAAQGTTEINLEQNTAPETATAAAILRFRAKLRDPEQHEVRVRAGFFNPTFDEPIKAGQTIRITPAYHFLAKFNFNKTRRTYLTESQIRELHLAEKFPDINSEQMVIKNQKLGPGLAAVGRWVPLNGMSPVYTPTRYLWLRTESVRDMTPEFAKPFVPGIETLKRLPIDLAFSKAGGRSSSRLGDVIGDHALWTASLEAGGTIVLTAKQDLGLLTFIERFERDQASLVTGEKDLVVKDMVMDSVIEERRSLTQAVDRSSAVVLKRDPITIVQSRYVVFFVSYPAKTGTAAVESANAPVVAP